MMNNLFDKLTIDEFIKELSKFKERFGGDKEIKVLFSEVYPCERIFMLSSDEMDLFIGGIPIKEDKS